MSYESAVSAQFMQDLAGVITRSKQELESELRAEYLKRLKQNIVRDVRNEVSDNWHFYSTFAVVTLLAYVVWRRIK